MRRAQRSQGPQGRTPERSAGVDGVSTSLTIEALVPGRSRGGGDEAGAGSLLVTKQKSDQLVVAKAAGPSAGRSAATRVLWLRPAERRAHARPGWSRTLRLR